MMLVWRLAFKNLFGGGLRTWLNALALSLSFVAIILMQSLYNGIGNQIKNNSVEALYAGGQYWQQDYDPYDVLTIDDAHAKLPLQLKELIAEKQATPILIRRASIFPQGRIQNIMIKGIDPEQKIVSIPSTSLKKGYAIPGLIGNRMAKNTKLNIGDTVMVRWKNAQGQFDADQIEIVEIMKTDLTDIDNNQIWIPLEHLRKMTGLIGEATFVVLEKESNVSLPVAGWEYKSIKSLLADVTALMAADNIGAAIMYLVLLILAMLAIFDTQIFAIFRRRKEIGTLIALGMTRGRVIQLFTLEGALNSVLAAFLALLYGAPIIIYFSKVGITMPKEAMEGYGLALGNVIYPEVTIGLILGTSLLIFIITTIVSYLPARKIAKLNPTEALRGKIG